MNEYEALTPGAMTPLAEMPPLVNAKKLTTFVWSLLFGIILYVIIQANYSANQLRQLFQTFCQKSKFAVNG